MGQLEFSIPGGARQSGGRQSERRDKRGGEDTYCFT